jgi:hypothetical protein
MYPLIKLVLYQIRKSGTFSPQRRVARKNPTQNYTHWFATHDLPPDWRGTTGCHEAYDRQDADRPAAAGRDPRGDNV